MDMSYKIMNLDINPINNPHHTRTRNFVVTSLPLGFIHLLFAILFFILDMPWLTTVNVASALSYVSFGWLARQDRIHTALFLTIVEVAIFAILSVYFIGWESGYYLWLLLLPNLIFAGYRWHTWLKVAMVIICLVLLCILAFFIRPLDPYYQIDQLVRQVIFYFNGLMIFASFASAGFLLFRITERAELEAYEAHQQTRSLLLNILPESIADRLTENPGIISDTYPEASILFADLVGFTAFSSTMKADEVVVLLNSIFSEFDMIVENLGLEKIKTIGDGYMIASGIPTVRPDHASALITCGLRMLETIAKFNTEQGLDLDVRIGIHSGPVVAGVIGKNKFSYDMWGDTVNTASRMESHGVPGKIQITEDTYQLVNQAFQAVPREAIEVKGKGMMNTYFVDLLDHAGDPL